MLPQWLLSYSAEVAIEAELSESWEVCQLILSAPFWWLLPTFFKVDRGMLPSNRLHSWQKDFVYQLYLQLTERLALRTVFRVDREMLPSNLLHSWQGNVAFPCNIASANILQSWQTEFVCQPSIELTEMFCLPIFFRVDRKRLSSNRLHSLQKDYVCERAS